MYLQHAESRAGGGGGGREEKCNVPSGQLMALLAGIDLLEDEYS